MNYYTLANAKVDPFLVTAADNCGGDMFVSYLNTAIAEILRAGDWFQTLARAEVCIDQKCIVWPRWVGKVRAANICNRSVMVAGQWATFMPFQPGCQAWWTSYNGGFKSDYMLVQEGLSPIYRQIPCGKNWYIRLTFERNADVGKEVTIYGVDSNGQTIRTTKADGIYSEGVTLVAAKPFASTSFTVRRITRVSLGDFVGMVRIYAYDADNDVLHDIGTYEPGEREPQYIYNRITGGGCCANAGNCNHRSVNVLFKVSEDRLRLDTDILQVQNIEALTMMIQAVKRRMAGEIDAYKELFVGAIACMNRQENDWLPLGQIPVEISAFGSAQPNYMNIGRNI